MESAAHLSHLPIQATSAIPAVRVDDQKPLNVPSLRLVGTALTNETYQALAGKGFRVPQYDRAALKVGIVSMGGTSRLAGGLVYDIIDDYLNKHKDEPDKQKWGVAAVGFSPHNKNSPSTIDNLEKQDGLYTLVKKGMDNAGEITTDCRVIGCIKETLQAHDDQARIISLIASPDVKMVTMSILSENYCLDKQGIGIDFNLKEAADLLHDLQDPRNPNSSIGLLVEGLRQRMEQHPGADITVLCCDNLAAPSGDKVKAAILSYTHRLGEAQEDLPLYRWIRDHVHFPNTMVDRIVPKPGDEAQHLVEDLTGISDSRTLVTEPDAARCIVIQNTAQAAGGFFSDNPFTDIPGVIFAGDEAPNYGIVKEAMVNADHVWSTLIGEFFLYKTDPNNPKIPTGPNIHEVVTHPSLKGLRETFVDAELTPSILSHVPPGRDIEAYKGVVEDRFANAGLPDPVSRISFKIFGRLTRILKIIDRLHDRSLANENDLLAIDKTCQALAGWAISRVHAKVAYGKDFSLIVMDGKEERPIEAPAVMENINLAKRLSGFQADLQSHGLDTAMQRVFLQMCDMKMFGETSSKPAFQAAMKRALTHMVAFVEAKL